LSLRVVVTAAGQGRRMGGGNKMLVPLGGEPILVRTLRVFQDHPRVAEVAVSAPAGQEEDYRSLFRRHGLDRVRRVVTGGAERQDSIFQALQALDLKDGDRVAVHDGARPLVSAELLDRLCEALEGWDGVVPGVPVKDTIKQVDEHGRVLKTLVRSELMAVQTPQVFRAEVLLEAYRQALSQGHVGTDDASLVEWFQGRVRVIPGDYRNLKITTAEDLALAESLLEEGAVAAP